MRILPVLLAAVALLASSPSALAGTYDHVSLPPGSDGWSPSVGAPGGYVSAADAVAAGGGLQMLFWARSAFAPHDQASWTYTAPPGTEIAGWRAEREVTGLGGGDWNAIVWTISDGGGYPAIHDVPAFNRPWGAIGLSGLHASAILVRLSCGGPHACVRGGTIAAMGVRAAVATLRDDAAPAV